MTLLFWNICQYLIIIFYPEFFLFWNTKTLNLKLTFLINHTTQIKIAFPRSVTLHHTLYHYSYSVITFLKCSCFSTTLCGATCWRGTEWLFMRCFKWSWSITWLGLKWKIRTLFITIWWANYTAAVTVIKPNFVPTLWRLIKMKPLMFLVVFRFSCLLQWGQSLWVTLGFFDEIAAFSTIVLGL